MHSQVRRRALQTCTAAKQACPARPHAVAPARRSTTLNRSAATNATVTGTNGRFRAQPTSQDFHQQLQQLSDWQATYGTCYVPPSAADAPRLYKWVQRTRQAANQGVLDEEQKKQLESLGFVWKPNVIDAKWHCHYHSLRCLLKSGAITLQQLQQQQGSMPDQQQQQQQQLEPDMDELSGWLQRQVVLYGKLKLTPVKVKLLRQLGVKLHRQAGLSRDNLHPLLQGKDPQAYKRRPLIVEPATQEGRKAVGRLLQQWQNWQQQQQQQQEQRQFTLQDPECAFMCVLAELQKWKKKYGSCVVPMGVFDKPELADWVQQIRRARTANPAAAAAAADHGSDLEDSISHSSTSSSSSSSEEAHDCKAAIIAADNSAQQQQQQQQEGPVLSAAAAVPTQLQTWHIQELDASGFCWHVSRADLTWHEAFHKLRAFKHKYHHLDVHRALVEAALETVSSGTNHKRSSNHHLSGTGFTIEDLTGLSNWLQQQRKLLGLSAWGVAQLPGGKDTAGGQQKGLSKLQQRMLRDLGVQPLPVVVGKN